MAPESTAEILLDRLRKSALEVKLADHGESFRLGLIASELVSNAFKHGYSDGRNGRIAVTLRNPLDAVREGDFIDSCWCELGVRDYGAGIDNPSGIWERRSMGLRIIRLLTQQLHGTVRLDQSRGTCFGVRFPLRSIKDRRTAL